ncbi:MAG TPA: polyhydroxyalkanoate synthesis repressor PhaR [Candidatus Thiothrix moscowensis]|uniref:polyhydroxyalkanoate synthesis repressor PhaR n=1 Tax=unclassified Thiothrix TaxID=2636184 RepID=UPI001A2FBF93|nr:MULTISPECIES: polyhydroxyalkanoate synthesis repressor PhaR [unclassified Thiothrix]MBJ6611166.1 polyhydroxyalkanoate synthesis repressor PhaR [Candidatus Thiothrix moscowensis]HRJ52907.1 polyhydroxyalkanoate synthesis repressor PhaR [Candidatus Thiothrix moscowensis]HRJ93457.1 polyhydroxyalkanoate synthesis repressor PhaR [Candidatus Thiothrix moscowensis]
MAEERIIKKYPNRRLYDTTQSCYITLNDVRDLVLADTPFKVIDRQSGDDITRSILLQIIMEQESGGQPLFSADILEQFIRNYSDTTRMGFSEYMRQSIDLFTSQQTAMREQMHKVLAGTPLDTWLKVGEHNMHTWQKMQESIMSSLQPKK